MKMNKNTHYTNKHGKQLRDYMLAKNPELWEQACLWSAIKYYIRAGKKDGESEFKDLKKCEDYLNELNMIDPILYDLDDMLEELSAIAEDFEEFND